MKKVGIAAGLLILVIVAGFLLTRRSPSATGTGAAPSTTLSAADTAALQSLVRDCYQWYVNAYAKLEPPAAQPTPDSKAIQCFTPAFIASWRHNDSGVDPVLLAQDYFESWLSSVQTTLVYATPVDVTVKTVLGTGSEARTILVRVTKDNDAWQIAAVKTP